jgi:phosphatidylglycerol:prolipoprotein diacylglycerol transferase
VIAFYLPGKIPVYAFSLIIALGTFVGMMWIVWQSSEEETLQNMEACLWALLGALVGSRIVFVASNWSYFCDHLGESVQIHLGGLTWPGAVAGGLIALAIYSEVKRKLFTKLADDLVSLLVCLSVSCWLGCWMDGCFYGAIISTHWGVPSPDEWGQVVSRSPVQLIGALFSLGLFWASERAVRRGNFKTGTLACLGLLNLSLISFCLSFLRVDPVLSWWWFHLDAWAALIFAGLGLFTLFTIYRWKKRKV